MKTITGQDLNEMSTLDEVRKVLNTLHLECDVFQGDLNDITVNSVVWCESATSTNLPSGATQGFLYTKTTLVNGDLMVSQEFNGTDGSQGVTAVRYKVGDASFHTWSA